MPPKKRSKKELSKKDEFRDIELRISEPIEVLDEEEGEKLVEDKRAKTEQKIIGTRRDLAKQSKLNTHDLQERRKRIIGQGVNILIGLLLIIVGIFMIILFLHLVGWIKDLKHIDTIYTIMKYIGVAFLGAVIVDVMRSPR